MDLTATVRSPGYLKLLIFAGLIGIPISLAALGFMTVVQLGETWLWHDLPNALGTSGPPWWLVIAIPLVAGIPVALARKLPGDGGHHPLVGFAGGATTPKMLPSVLLAAFFTLASGVVLGQEAPLIALGGGLALLFGARAAKGNVQTAQMLTMCGAFAAISTIFGNPLAAAILLVEAMAIGGNMLTIVLLPGLLSAGVGYLVFTGVGSWTGFATPSLSLPTVPPGGAIVLADIPWAILVGAVIALVMVGARRLGQQIETVATKVDPLVMLPICGALVGAAAVAYNLTTGQSPLDLLFSGENGVGDLGAYGPTTAVTTLVALAVLKAIAYAVSLGSGFRGGPIFPSLFIGATLGMIAGLTLPGMSPLAGFAAGMAAGTASMMRLPLAALVIVGLLCGSAGLQVLPIVIIAVVVAVVVRAFTDQDDPSVAAAPHPA